MSLNEWEQDNIEVLISREMGEWLGRRENRLLNNIRAEIKTKYDSIPWRNNDYDDGWIEALEWVFDNVLDKHMAESEDK